MLFLSTRQWFDMTRRQLGLCWQPEGHPGSKDVARPRPIATRPPTWVAKQSISCWISWVRAGAACLEHRALGAKPQPGEMRECDLEQLNAQARLAASATAD